MTLIAFKQCHPKNFISDYYSLLIVISKQKPFWNAILKQRNETAGDVLPVCCLEKKAEKSKKKTFFYRTNYDCN